jgi:hypothetical protein
VRPAHGLLEELLDDSLNDWRHADRFGWLPSQVAEESKLKIWAIDMIDQVVTEIRNKQNNTPPSSQVNGNGRR